MANGVDETPHKIEIIPGQIWRDRFPGDPFGKNYFLVRKVLAIQGGEVKYMTTYGGYKNKPSHATRFISYMSLDQFRSLTTNATLEKENIYPNLRELR
jgi:hypothetical protein